MVDDLRAAREAGPEFPELLFIHRSPVAAGEAFFAEHGPDLAWISDEDAALNDAFGRRSGSLWQLLGPKVWLHGWRAFRRGHRVGKMAKDPMRMPGLFVVRNGKVLFEHDFTDAGDQPDLEAVRAAVA